MILFPDQRADACSPNRVHPGRHQSNQHRPLGFQAGQDLGAVVELGPWSGPGWEVKVAREVAGVYRMGDFRQPVEKVNLDRRWWWIWHRLRGPDGQTLAKLKRATEQTLDDLAAALRLAPLEPRLTAAMAWADIFDNALSYAEETRRWLTREGLEDLERSRPAGGLKRLLEERGLLDRVSSTAKRAARLLDENLAPHRATVNKRTLDRELEAMSDFFNTIEKSPLTKEQAEAVVTMDNRVQLLAAAGSGKTSVMVARAAYAVARGLIEPNRILLLAFNRDAAAELRDRVATRLEAAGLRHEGVTATTFHAFGMSVIGAATGKKPRLAKWLDSNQEAERKSLQLVDELRDADVAFRRNWDLFRTVYGPASDEIAGGTADRWDRDRKAPAFATFAGESVKSEGERLVANWLFLSGVPYSYEKPYPIDTRDGTHGQYHPDFHYPEIDVWHEHWAVDRNGEPPPSFQGYRESMSWKRDLHAAHVTTLIESTWADVVFGDGLDRLAAALEAHGQELDWNPDRPPLDDWARPIEHASMVRLVRTFMAHVKANRLTREESYGRAAAAAGGEASVRTQVFLDAYWRFHDRWEEELRAHRAIDFDDMLGQAADILESGHDPGYELVLVDEFQDTSRVRARVAAALVKPRGRHLLAVGDDWQSINRFAGSDVSVMKEFERWFGDGPRLALTNTFRCPQVICDVASEFVAKNPGQLPKTMKAADGRIGLPVRLVGTDAPAEALDDVLGELAAKADDTSRPTVDILVRYGFLADDPEIRRVIRVHAASLELTTRTVHGSKGLEADYIVVLGVNGGTYGFPSEIEDDPVLNLAMPEPDAFEHAEERRLFYVALSRAREQVIVLTDRTSPFVMELLDDDPDPSHISPQGFELPIRVCSECRKGLMLRKESVNGPFLGCSTFPACGNTSPIRPPDAPDCTSTTCDGWLQLKSGRSGAFWGCSNYRVTGCPVTVSVVPDDAEECPRGCGGHLLLKTGRNGDFWGCSNWQPGNQGCRFTRST